MSIIYVLIPIAILFVAIGIGIFFWAVRSKQFEDLEKEGLSILFDEDKPKVIPPNKPDEH
ncbi:cbb3-type cytochrome oxidase assembly protein CcoS [Alishewanella sp. SMS8]|uniref:cbb3-type cytochrome oxidase assembly protein CcoS n=1 Tax=Alishewanella sp. SMS8 TaxID=2994676 RepID=UPI0027422FC9|nr:cbb3-type cytochrome oxidase assembly protein CcoS [Alishewanella sp. SMS8]MDP4944976.1 cbb3-type cytochrome oxidase assembly protein CcoS [Alishewanella sp.]MDP5206959.1 cbb3-type cytochrome oxidase assembly protein CcoS [Alishewanella sp. SMS9]MDP5457948.1 cbb3-type cytochrome oxidase assembly protein CcoS [Alishewanella sp. SMS8]